MGCFGYMCVGCRKNIREGEQAVLKHIRHGVVLGAVVGTYNSYGGVREDDVYRNHHDGINGHESICESEFKLLDSKDFFGKIYKGTPMDWMTYRKTKVAEGVEDLCEELYEEWASLPEFEQTPASGTEAWHAYCYDKRAHKMNEPFRLSESDEDQSWGIPRKKFTEAIQLNI